MAALFTGVHEDPLLQFILQLALTLALTRLIGKVFTYLQQPQVVGEIIAGVLLGPSVLGLIPGFTSTVWPTAIPLGPSKQPYDSTVTFGVVADVGVLLFMFMLGCELDHEAIKQQWKKSLPIALSAIAMPFAVGAAASLWLEEVNKEGQPADWEPPRYRSFMLFTGAAMSFTAFPVLASLLTTLGLLHVPIGIRVLSCAAVDDVTAWCVLALASSFAQSTSALQGLYTCLAAVAYVVVMVVLLQPALRRLHGVLLSRDLVKSPYYVCLVFLLLLASAYTTQALGIHCFFGAFMMGIITPKTGGFAETLADKMELVVVEVMLPLFFANSGIKTQIQTVNTIRYWGITLALVCIACFAKFTPACLMSKLLLRDKNWRFCVAIGLLMNTRGLVEVIALNIGLSMGILSPRMFTMMLLMALATTCTTTPLLHLLYRGRKQDLEGDTLSPAAAAAAQHARNTSVVFLHSQLAQKIRQETLMGHMTAAATAAAPQPAGVTEVVQPAHGQCVGEDVCTDTAAVDSRQSDDHVSNARPRTKMTSKGC